jgi:dGTPase
LKLQTRQTDKTTNNSNVSTEFAPAAISRGGWKLRQQMEADERRVLAPFAQKSGDSRGRKYPEPSHAFRMEFQRDRARIIHSRAFRRLEYKTQVFLNGTGDHLRTRLTHSIEVASISRTIARSLSLNEDLAETIALAHDLGHSPFGHSGEEMLAECMQEHGGFEHNRQSLRVVELLENAYPNFAGLNLTFEVREGLRKHQAFYEAPGPGEEKYRCPSLEAQIANLADEITYYSHDLDDAVDFEILNAPQLEENAVWQRSRHAVLRRYPEAREPELHKLIIRDIIDVEVQDVVTTSAQSIVGSQPRVATLFISECLLPSPCGGGEPASIRDVEESFRSICCRTRSPWRGGGKKDRSGRAPSHSLRLHCRNDRSISDGGIRADCSSVAASLGRCAPGWQRNSRSRAPVFFPQILDHKPQPLIYGKLLQNTLAAEGIAHES